MARKRSVRGIGSWIDDEGNERGAVVGINVADGSANVTVGPILTPDLHDISTGDRRIAYFIGRIEAAIRATDWRNRPISPDPKPKNRKPIRRRKVNATEAVSSSE